MGFNREKMFFNRTPKDIEIDVFLPCGTCNKVYNIECPVEIHDGSVEKVPLQVVGVPWAKRNYIKSQCVSFNDKQQTHFDSQQYIAECLKLMIVKAPWGNTDDMFLLQVGDALGDALEKLVPSAYNIEENMVPEESFSEIKKELVE